jgi:hypothetical protein
MKYLNTYKIFEATLVDKKIQLLRDLALELQDIGLQVEVINGSHSHLLRDDSRTRKWSGLDNIFIVMRITDDNKKFDTDLYNTEIIDDFKETLKSYGMNPRRVSGGRNFCVFKFDKHGKMTNSPIIRESNSNKEVLNEIEEIFREISDIGFRVEYYNHLSSNRSVLPSDGELLKIYIEKSAVYGFSNEERDVKYYPTQEFVDAFLHLISYVDESNLNHRIEVIDNSKILDILSNEYEIEDMIHWKEPIDYIKITITEKDNISESIKPEYDFDWKKPGNPIREELEVELREILLEVIDMGYRPQLSGFTKGFSENGPYVWICNQRRKTHDDFWNEITDVVERVKDYLTEKGFNVNQEIINEGGVHEQVYIYFNMSN